MDSANDNEAKTAVIALKAPTPQARAIVPMPKIPLPIPPKATPNLEDLPHELQVEICHRVFRPADLVPVCLTSRKLHAAAIVALYRDVAIDVTGRDASKTTAGMLSRENEGVDHVRGLTLVYTSQQERGDEDKNDEDKNDENLLYALEVATYVVNGLPRDKLRSFW